MTDPVPDDEQPEFIVIGSGAGGGTLAARLAEAGRHVVLLEAGDDAQAAAPPPPGLAEQYQVPAFHALSTENRALCWDYFVRHYADRAMQERDPKFVASRDGVFYPRAGTLGGCTAHNAQILVYPHNEDWDAIADLTRDESWRADRMRRHFERLENCRHRPLYRWLRWLGFNPTRHGWGGWLHSEVAIPATALEDADLVDVITQSVFEAFKHVGDLADQVRQLAQSSLDPNDWRIVRERGQGLRYAPLTTKGHHRMGTRERLLDVAARHPDRLKLRTNAFATRIVFDARNRATGVEYLQAARRAYGSDEWPRGFTGEKRLIRATREIVLAGGAFNTPQLLMLSGIGPRAELDRLGIPVRVELDGVGRNLQDRYEVGVVNRMRFPAWPVLKDAKFDTSDPQYAEWSKKPPAGVYTTNGAVLAVIKKSLAERPLPDLFIFALLGLFRGYFPGYSKLLAEKHNYLTWAILKAHTENRGGTVRLRSADPLDPPLINFHYFGEGTDKAGEDLKSVVEGIKFVRELTKDLVGSGLIEEEELPGKDIQSDAELADFVETHAWGHHASCTCAIGDREAGGVLSSDFKVHGTTGLRVVDASVFPRIPGFFIVSAVYMIAEKAAEVMLAENRK
jgi:choline dehydrogenase-like flavoprotein